MRMHARRLIEGETENGNFFFVFVFLCAHTLVIQRNSISRTATNLRMCCHSLMQWQCSGVPRAKQQILIQSQISLQTHTHTHTFMEAQSSRHSRDTHTQKRLKNMKTPQVNLRHVLVYVFMCLHVLAHNTYVLYIYICIYVYVLTTVIYKGAGTQKFSLAHTKYSTRRKSPLVSSSHGCPSTYTYTCVCMCVCVCVQELQHLSAFIHSHESLRAHTSKYKYTHTHI